MKINLAYNSEIMPVKIDGDTWTLRLFYNDKDYIIKYYDIDNSKTLIDKFLYACENGLCKLNLFGYTDKILVYEDVMTNDNYRKINTCEDICLVAMWYKNLHSIVIDKFDNYRDYFTYNNVIKVIRNYNLDYNEAMTLIAKNFSNIDIKLSRNKQCLILDDFNDKKFAFKKDTNEVICLDFDGLKRGLCYIDIMKICDNIGDEARAQLIKSYGEISKDEIIMCDVIDPIIRLYLLIDRESNGEKSKLLEVVSSKKYIEKVQSLIEWY